MQGGAKPIVVGEPHAVRKAVASERDAGRRVGLVPTMGNLHAGHAGLLQAARSENDVVVATIFVNPLQFDSADDLSKYPRTLNEDLAVCAREGVDLVFAPSAEAMYPAGSTTIVQVKGIEDPLCGRDRPGHFIGVATVVAKLFHLAPAHAAYFGLKDFQQTVLVKRMAADLCFPIEIRCLPTVREPDGLAMSSRNSRLSPADRRQAVVLHRSLERAKELVGRGERDVLLLRSEVAKVLAAAPSAAVDYVALVDPDTLASVESVKKSTLLALAVRFGAVRLIDNTLLDPAQEHSG